MCYENNADKILKRQDTLRLYHIIFLTKQKLKPKKKNTNETVKNYQ